MKNRACKKAAGRYPLSFAMRYVMTEDENLRAGLGETVWMSGTEVAFLAKGAAAVGDRLEMYIEWPVMLDGEVPLQLIVTAEVAQRSGPLSVARITKHEFRTRRIQSAAALWRQPLVISTWDSYPARQMVAGG